MMELQDNGAMRVQGHRLLPSLEMPQEWAQMLRLDDLDDGITISCWDGKPLQDLDTEARGPAMFCIGIFIEGQATMAVDGGLPLHVRPGMVAIQAADRPVSGRFTMAGGTPIRLVDIRFTPQGLLNAGGRPLLAQQRGLLHDCSVPQAGSQMGGMMAPPALLRLAGDILDCQYSDRTLRSLYLRAKALEALAIVLHSLGETPAVAVSARERRQLAEARRLLDERYAEEWTIPRLARAVGLNEKKLQAGFRAMAGRSVHAHLRALRLEAAAAMLERGMAVGDAAHAAGFSNLSHFSKTFREEMGVSPRHWAGAGTASASSLAPLA